MDNHLLTSTINPIIKRIRALAQRKHREEQRAFFVEGIRPVWQAVESNTEIELLVVAPELLTSDAARQMIDAQSAAGTRVVNVTRAVFENIAQRENPSGLGAIVRMTHRTLADLSVTPRSIFVALTEVGNPGNLGTIIRTVDAVGGNGIILIGTSTDPYNPTAVKASMGALFNVPIVYTEKSDEVRAWCRANGIHIVTTSARAPMQHWAVEYPRPALLLFGSEGAGLSDTEWQQGDLSVAIPMHGTADSLNLAVSVGVLLYEVIRPTRV